MSGSSSLRSFVSWPMRCPGGVNRVVFQEVPVVLHGGAATRGVHDDGLDPAGLHLWPPGVDVGAHLGTAAVLVIEVELDRATTARLGGDHGLDAGSVQHARGGAVDVGHHRGLHAAGQHQDLARMGARGPGAGRLLCGHLGLQRGGQQAAQGLAHFHGGAEQRRGQALLQRPAQGFFRGRAWHFGVHNLAADVQQVAILHATGTGAFAVAAGQAAVQVQLGLARGRLAFQHLFHQVDAATRAVELVAEQLVGRAGRGAEAAVHAFAQDGFGLAAFGSVLVFGSEMGLHGVPGAGSEAGRQPAAVENARRVELGFQALVNPVQRCLQGLKSIHSQRQWVIVCYE